VTAHRQPSRTEWNALGVDALGSAGRLARAVTLVEHVDRRDLFGEQILIDTTPIVPGVIDGAGELERQALVSRDFEQSI
jgi:hypothetical protein